MGRFEDPFTPRLDADDTTALCTPPPLSGILTARLQGFDLDDRPMVTGLPQLPHEQVPARSTVALTRTMVGEDVVVVLDQGDPRRPIVIGVIQPPRPLTHPVTPSGSGPVKVYADGERFVVDAAREIVLRCGDASITLTRAGKVVIRGKYVLSRSSGCNKIKGASIEIN